MKSFFVALALSVSLAGLCDGAPDLKGLYDAVGGVQLILTDKGLAAFKNGDGKYLRYGSWETAKLEGGDCVVLHMRDEKEWMLETDPYVVILDVLPDAKGLQARGNGGRTLAEAVAAMNQPQPEALPRFTLRPNAFGEELAKEVAAAIEKVNEPIKRQQEIERRQEARKRLEENPKLLRNVKFKYPELDPEESLPDVESIPALYPQSMRLVFELLSNSEVKIDKETLEGMLDRVDWDRGDVLAFTILRRDELDAGSLRKYAKQALARIGKSDRKILSWYLNRSDLPQDILEAAVKAGWSK